MPIYKSLHRCGGGGAVRAAVAGRRAMQNLAPKERPRHRFDADVVSVPFTQPDTAPFAWLMHRAPCFPVSAQHITILREPTEFYHALTEGCSKAKERITIASLYWGTGIRAQRLVENVLENEAFRRGQVRVRVLLDYTRGTRIGPGSDSRPLLQRLLLANHWNCHVALYHTPVLRGLLKWAVPHRWNELFGLQHMKLYIFDDTLLISGANLSHDYFTNRQDRYYVIKDKSLCDFYDGLVAKVQKFSLKMEPDMQMGLHPDWKWCPYEGDKTEFVCKASREVHDYILTATANNHHVRNMNRIQAADTWIFPLIQMGQLYLRQESKITEQLLGSDYLSSPSISVGGNNAGDTLYLATGYFNLTREYMATLVRSRANTTYHILSAHPLCNGFWDAKGVAGAIPDAYTLIWQRFQQMVVRYGQQHRFALLEYLRDRWTYHAKGLWYYHGATAKTPQHWPVLTLIGSPNFGERSVHKDLETQVCIVTENQDLRKRMHEECQHLFTYGTTADIERKVMPWIYPVVLLFRSYF